MAKKAVRAKLKAKSYVCKAEVRFEKKKQKTKSSEDAECSNKKKRKSHGKLNY